MNWPRLIGDILVAFLLVMLIAAGWSGAWRGVTPYRVTTIETTRPYGEWLRAQRRRSCEIRGACGP
jgi:hypothetical protein